MPTAFERSIIQKRKSQGILRPLLEELFQSKVEVETEEDAEFLKYLALKQVEREQMRTSGQGVFSPSGLASCLRRVYLGRHWQNLGLERVELPSLSAHYYFTTGDFIHFKWQFAIYKLAQKNPRVKLLEVEMMLMSKHKDHGGTADLLVAVDDVPIIVDVKGLNVRAFANIVRGDTPHEYRIQLGDYMMLFNALSQRYRPDFPKVENAILLVESKGGPDPYHALGIHEVVIPLKSVLPEVQTRLGVLREHEAKEEIPAPECTSTRSVEYQGCPFAAFCKKEVKAIEKRNAKGSDSEIRVASPNGNRRTRRSRPNRRGNQS